MKHGDIYNLNIPLPFGIENLFPPILGGSPAGPVVSTEI